MKRRTALKNMGLLTGGILLYPACDFSEENITVILRNLQIRDSQQVLLEEIVATILPEGDLPGAKSLKAQNFVWGIVGECMNYENQKSYLKGLQEFDLKFNQTEDQSFVTLSEKERVKILIDLTKNKTKEDDLQEFVETTKKLTIHGYMMSQFIMTEIMPYQLVPGAYATCETIDPNKRINTNA